MAPKKDTTATTPAGVIEEVCDLQLYFFYVPASVLLRQQSDFFLLHVVAEMESM